MAENIILECTECGDRSYLSKKNKRKHPERLTLKMNSLTFSMWETLKHTVWMETNPGLCP